MSYSGTEFIYQLPGKEQRIISDAISKVEGSDLPIAMAGRLCDLEDNIDWRALLND